MKEKLHILLLLVAVALTVGPIGLVAIIWFAINAQLILSFVVSTVVGLVLAAIALVFIFIIAERLRLSDLWAAVVSIIPAVAVFWIFCPHLTWPMICYDNDMSHCAAEFERVAHNGDSYIIHDRGGATITYLGKLDSVVKKRDIISQKYGRANSEWWTNSNGTVKTPF